MKVLGRYVAAFGDSDRPIFTLHGVVPFHAFKRPHRNITVVYIGC